MQSYLLSLLIFILLGGALFLLDDYGKDARTPGQRFRMHEPRVNTMVFDDPVQVYAAWKSNGLRGRVLVSLSRRLNFVFPTEKAIMPSGLFPPEYFSFSQAVERNLGAENFLLVSLESGLARKIVHLVPERLYAERFAFRRDNGGAVHEQDRVALTFFGSPRIITTMRHFAPPREPVLLYVNASVFRDDEPEALLRWLLATDLEADQVALCRSFDDSEVTEGERKKLAAFGRLWEDFHGNP